MPRLLGLDPRCVAGLKDYYETTMLDTNLAAGIAGRRSVFNLAVRGLRRHKVVGEKRVEDAEGPWMEADRVQQPARTSVAGRR